MSGRVVRTDNIQDDVGAATTNVNTKPSERAIEQPITACHCPGNGDEENPIPQPEVEPGGEERARGRKYSSS